MLLGCDSVSCIIVIKQCTFLERLTMHYIFAPGMKLYGFHYNYVDIYHEKITQDWMLFFFLRGGVKEYKNFLDLRAVEPT